MKKFALILLICIYSLSTVGFSLKEFYCCGKLKSVTVALAQDTKQKCSKGDKEGCCKTKYQYFKVKDNHLSSAHVATLLNSFSDLHTITPSYQSISFVTLEIDVINGNHAPPLHTGVPIYLSNCVFRI